MTEALIATTGNDEVVPGDIFAVLRRTWWKAALFSTAVGAVTLFIMFQLPNEFRATATISPVGEEPKPNLALGALASSIGLPFGAASKVEDLEALFKSRDLTARVFRNHDLWPAAFPRDFDSKTGKLRVGWKGWLRGEKSALKAPEDWDAIRVADDNLRVTSNKRMGNLSISFASPSAEASATIVRYYLEEAKSRLQEEAYSRATRNKRFIEEKIGKTIDALTRDRLYSLYGQEVEREMMAQNREQFGFKVIDSPRVPDRKTGPHRIMTSAAAALMTFVVSMFLFAVRRR